MTKLLSWLFKQCFGSVIRLTVQKCCYTGLFPIWLSPLFAVSYFRNKSTLTLIFCFKVLKILFRLRKWRKKIKKRLFDLEMIAFELIALNTCFYGETIFVIGCQQVKKKAQDFRYNYIRNFRADFLSNWWRNMTKILPCRFKQSFGHFNELTVHKCCETELFRHLSNPSFSSQ